MTTHTIGARRGPLTECPNLLQARHACESRWNGASERPFYVVSALLFATSVTATLLWGASMAAMDGMQMPGGWTMSMAWMRMPGQTWAGAAASFVGMWMLMMVAMMLPSLVPMLSRYRRAIGGLDHEPRLGRLTLLVGCGYFLVWLLLGFVAFPVGVMLARVTMQMPSLARAVPVAIGAIVMIAGALQFTTWKARHLACCRHSSQCANPMRPNTATAWQHGIKLGIHCAHCCAGLTAVLLVMGVMDLRAMTAVTGAITLERLAPAGQRVARAIGVALIALGSWLTLSAVKNFLR